MRNNAMRKGGLEPPRIAPLDPKSRISRLIKGSNRPLRTEGSQKSPNSSVAATISAVSVRFWSKVDRSAGLDGCWPWTGCHDDDGYGQLKIAGKVIKAHRVALEYALGVPLGELKALHSCDNPPCCNPAHLFAGTTLDNMQDKVAKGRHHESRKTHCPAGHDYTPENTRVFIARGTERRRCKQCERDQYEARKAVA